MGRWSVALCFWTYCIGQKMHVRSALTLIHRRFIQLHVPDGRGRRGGGIPGAQRTSSRSPLEHSRQRRPSTCLGVSRSRADANCVLRRQPTSLWPRLRLYACLPALLLTETLGVLKKFLLLVTTGVQSLVGNSDCVTYAISSLASYVSTRR